MTEILSDETAEAMQAHDVIMQMLVDLYLAVRPESELGWPDEHEKMMWDINVRLCEALKIPIREM